MLLNRAKGFLTRASIHAVLLLGAAIAIFPFAWLIITSLKSFGEASRQGILPSRWLFSNYPDAISMINLGHPNLFWQYFLNSTIMGVFTVAGVLITSTLAAYAFARMMFPGREILFMVLLATMMIPFELTLVPNFIIVTRLGWIDHYEALIVPWTANAFSIFLLRQFFRSIPKDLYDAAVLDGANHLRFLISIVIPLSRPALITTALLTFLGSWNSLLWPILVTNKLEMRPIQYGVLSFIGEAATQMQLLMAAVTISILPIILLYFVAQRWFIQGIANVGIRG